MKINGQPVVYAKKPFTIHITKADCENGQTKDPGGCAAARALKREMGAKAARVHVARTYLLIDDKWVCYATGDALRSELIAFDRGGTFEPGDYAVRPVSRADQTRSRDRGRNTTKRASHKNKGIRRQPAHVTTGIRPKGANR